MIGPFRILKYPALALRTCLYSAGLGIGMEVLLIKSGTYEHMREGEIKRMRKLAEVRYRRKKREREEREAAARTDGSTAASLA
eukprot:g3642.t1